MASPYRMDVARLDHKCLHYVLAASANIRDIEEFVADVIVDVNSKADLDRCLREEVGVVGVSNALFPRLGDLVRFVGVDPSKFKEVWRNLIRAMHPDKTTINPAITPELRPFLDVGHSLITSIRNLDRGLDGVISSTDFENFGCIYVPNMDDQAWGKCVCGAYLKEWLKAVVATRDAAAAAAAQAPQAPPAPRPPANVSELQQRTADIAASGQLLAIENGPSAHGSKRSEDIRGLAVFGGTVDFPDNRIVLNGELDIDDDEQVPVLPWPLRGWAFATLTGRSLRRGAIVRGPQNWPIHLFDPRLPAGGRWLTLAPGGGPFDWSSTADWLVEICHMFFHDTYMHPPVEHRYAGFHPEMVLERHETMSLTTWLKTECDIADGNKNNIVWVIAPDAPLTGKWRQLEPMLPLRLRDFVQELRALRERADAGEEGFDAADINVQFG